VGRRAQLVHEGQRLVARGRRGQEGRREDRAKLAQKSRTVRYSRKSLPFST
jgi:hypothetical protein